jgi:AAA family ATPase
VVLELLGFLYGGEVKTTPGLDNCGEGNMATIIVYAYNVRPLPMARKDLLDVFRVHMSKRALESHGLKPGEICDLHKPEGGVVPGIAWLRSGNVQDNVLQITDAFRERHDLKLDKKLGLAKNQEGFIHVQEIQLVENLVGEQSGSWSALSEAQQNRWLGALEQRLYKCEALYPGLPLGSVEFLGTERSFIVATINGSAAARCLYRFLAGSKISIQDSLESAMEKLEVTTRDLAISMEGLAGLNQQVQQLNFRLKALNTEMKHRKIASYYQPPRGGVLIHGPAGTGKSLLLQKLAQTAWCKVFYLGRNETNLQKVVEQARNSQPCLIVVDNLESLIRNFEIDEKKLSKFGNTLLAAFDSLTDERILIVAACRELKDISETLLGPGYLEKAVETNVPKVSTRKEILKLLTGEPQDEPHVLLDSIGERTHGFVGADLKELVQLAAEKGEQRREQAEKDANLEVTFDNTDLVTEEDYNAALLEVYPSAIRSAVREAPKVQWDEIGGQHNVKEALEEAVEYPLKYQAQMSSLSLPSVKGILLYGPPGCSKTLTAAALATSASANFLAVKGSELLSMYVGESERAVRDVFRKARAAAPCIIFFDEIDAIGSSGAGLGNGGVNTTTTLLNELDGIEELRGVFVLAATNKPESLDAALIRPGRIDQLIYVGPPDLEARREILRIRIKKMAASEDIDIENLAERLAGYSGAEIVMVCHRAAWKALKEQKDTSMTISVKQKHFLHALTVVPKSITEDMIAHYEQWNKTRRSNGP